MALIGPVEATSLSGLILADPSGAPPASARITLTPQDGSMAPLAQVIHASGGFTFEGLAPATYDLLVEAPGFRPWQRIGLQIGNANVELPKIVLSVPMGCGMGGEARLTLIQRIRIKIKEFFVPRDHTLTCQ